VSAAAAWLVALLLAVRVPVAERRCIVARREAIASTATAAAEAHHVPVALLLSVAYLESHLGCSAHSGGCWGAPISRARRGVAGGADRAASALALGYRRCGGTPEGAVSSFRWGLCRVPPGARGYGPATVMRFAARVAARVAQ
jgi:hypothetical protein